MPMSSPRWAMAIHNSTTWDPDLGEDSPARCSSGHIRAAQHCRGQLPSRPPAFRRAFRADRTLRPWLQTRSTCSARFPAPLTKSRRPSRFDNPPPALRDRPTNRTAALASDNKLRPYPAAPDPVRSPPTTSRSSAILGQLHLPNRWNPLQPLWSSSRLLWS